MCLAVGVDFAGLVAYALVGWTWLDPVAVLVIAAFALSKGKEAWESELVPDSEDEDTGGD